MHQPKTRRCEMGQHQTPYWICTVEINSSEKSSLPLVKVTIFQKLRNIMQIKVHQEKQTHLPLIVIQNL